MENNKNILEAMTETQTRTMNNWIETTQKLQKAVAGGQALEKGNELYKEWLNNQMNIINKATNDVKNTAEATTANAGFDTQEFYKNWYNNQLTSVKQLMDYNQNLYNSALNFGKNTSELNSSYTAMNETLTTLYNNWLNTLNSTYDNLYTNLPGANLNKDAFKGMFNTTNMFVKMQEIITPWLKTMQNGTFNPDTFKNLMDPAKTKEVTEKLFESFFAYPNFKEMFNAYTKGYETFFQTQNNVGKDYFANLQNVAGHMPHLFSGDFAKMTGIYTQLTGLTQSAFGPMMRMIAPSREKQMTEMMLEMNDKATQFALKQTQMQYLLYTTGQKAMETTATLIAEKMKTTPTVTTTAQQLFTEWVSATEKVYLELFNSDDYSKLKGEMLALGTSLKKQMEKYFELTFENVPVVYRSEMDELYSTIHDLKKKVRDLETRLAVTNAATIEEEDETKTARTKKK